LLARSFTPAAAAAAALHGAFIERAPATSGRAGDRCGAERRQPISAADVLRRCHSTRRRGAATVATSVDNVVDVITSPFICA